MSLKFKIATNTFVQILGRFITAGTTFLITILIAREFGAEGYGEFTKIMTFVAFFYLISDFGLNAIAVKQISENEAEKEKIFANFLSLRIFSSVILVLLAIFIAAFLPYYQSQNQGFSSFVKLGIFIASFTIVTQAIFTTVNILFQKNLRYDLSVLSASTGTLFLLLWTIILISLGATLFLVIGGYIAGGVVMATMALFFARRFLKQLYLTFELKIWKKIFWQTLPLGLTLIFNLIYFRADMMILSFLRPNIEVGIYGLAYKFFEFPLAFATFFMNSTYPVILARVKDGDLKPLIKKLTIFLISAAFLITVIIFVAAPLLTLIKAEFSSSILALRVLSLSLPAFFLSSLFMWVLIAGGKQKLLAIFYGLSMLINVILNVVLIPRYGYLAAAGITGASEFLVLVLTGAGVIAFLKNCPRQ
ncbi:flippase [Candidatus Microgenomates bacterium]|nr:flippase [Candidatus Microgenomates bacterium]